MIALRYHIIVAVIIFLIIRFINDTEKKRTTSRSLSEKTARLISLQQAFVLSEILGAPEGMKK
jgi:large-conductance mechanosensitive channel